MKRYWIVSLATLSALAMATISARAHRRAYHHHHPPGNIGHPASLRG